MLALLLLGYAAGVSAHSAVEPVPREWKGFLERVHLLNERATKAGRGAQLLFVGDSITQGWEDAGKAAWEKHYASRGALNIGVGGDGTQNVLWRLDQGNVDGIDPRLAVVMIGTNNVTAGNTVAQVVEGVTAVVAKLRQKLPRTYCSWASCRVKNPEWCVARCCRSTRSTRSSSRTGERLSGSMPVLASWRGRHHIPRADAGLPPPVAQRLCALGRDDGRAHHGAAGAAAMKGSKKHMPALCRAGLASALTFRVAIDGLCRHGRRRHPGRSAVRQMGFQRHARLRPGRVRNGRIVQERGYGMANLEHGVRIRPDTVFHIASVSKQFTAAAIALLILDGRLSADDSIHKYLPEMPQFGRAITVGNPGSPYERAAGAQRAAGALGLALL